MTTPVGYRQVAGLLVPLDLVPRLVAAIQDAYAEAVEGITDPDELVQAALQAWARELLANHEHQAAVAPLSATVAQTITQFENLGQQARNQAIADGQRITRTIDSTT
jgi:hypothetical protein